MPAALRSRTKRTRRHIEPTRRLLGLLSYKAARKCRLNNGIRELRKKNRWTLKKLAQMCGVPYNTVWRMERGLGGRLDKAYKVAAAFQVTIYELYPLLPNKMILVAMRTDVHSVRELRLNHNWSLRELARASGVSSTTLCHIENGFIPKVDKAIKIADALGVSVYEIWKP